MTSATRCPSRTNRVSVSARFTFETQDPSAAAATRSKPGSSNRSATKADASKTIGERTLFRGFSGRRAPSLGDQVVHNVLRLAAAVQLIDEGLQALGPCHGTLGGRRSLVFLRAGRG